MKSKMIISILLVGISFSCSEEISTPSFDEQLAQVKEMAKLNASLLNQMIIVQKGIVSIPSKKEILNTIAKSYEKNYGFYDPNFYKTLLNYQFPNRNETRIILSPELRKHSDKILAIFSPENFIKLIQVSETGGRTKYDEFTQLVNFCQSQLLILEENILNDTGLTNEEKNSHTFFHINAL